MRKLNREEKKRIEEKWGKLTVPKGETERAKEIRKNAIAYEKNLIDELVEGLNLWLKMHPDSNSAEARNRFSEHDSAMWALSYKEMSLMRAETEKWDWREANIDVGPVMNQGDCCNTCWAFAAVSAAACSLQKNYQEQLQTPTYYTDKKTGELFTNTGAAICWAGDPSPFVQDLLNCMPIPEEELCLNGWHGKAFDFMVYGKGIPMCYADGYTDINPETGETITYRREYVCGRKFECNPNNGFIQANAWDYVNFPPDALPTVLQLKTALMAHGPLAAPIFYDNALYYYKGGVFDGQNMGMVNHIVLLIGWDDAKQAWLIKNSWGENWGEKGFGWIKYGSNNIGLFAAWIEADLNSFRGAPV